MNIFAKIVEVNTFNKVTFYSVVKEGERTNMFLEFVNRIAQKKELTEDLKQIQVWLKRIGDKFGAKEQYFRFEQAAHALPPPAKYIKMNSMLRLYCMRVNNNAVVLFSGDVKTTHLAQDCPHVRRYFNEAVHLTTKIDEAIRERQIQIHPVSGKLLINEDFEITL